MKLCLLPPGNPGDHWKDQQKLPEAPMLIHLDQGDASGYLFTAICLLGHRALMADTEARSKKRLNVPGYVHDRLAEMARFLFECKFEFEVLPERVVTKPVLGFRPLGQSPELLIQIQGKALQGTVSRYLFVAK